LVTSGLVKNSDLGALDLKRFISTLIIK